MAVVGLVRLAGAVIVAVVAGPGVIVAPPTLEIVQLTGWFAAMEPTAPTESRAGEEVIVTGSCRNMEAVSALPV